MEFWVENDSKVPGRIKEGDVVRAKGNRVREGNGGRFQGRRKGKRGRSVWADFRSSMFLCRLCMHWVLWWRWSLHWEERISGAVCHPQNSWWFTEWLAMISERSPVHRTKRTDPSTEPWGAPYMAGMVTKTSYWLKWTDICLRDMTETTGAQQTECQKQSSGGRREFGGQSCRKIRQKKKSRAERNYCLQYNIYNAVWLLDGWCHVKNCFCLGAFSVHRTTMHHATSLHAKPHTHGACLYSCNMPPALLAEWPVSFTCYCGNTVTQENTFHLLHLPGLEPRTFWSRDRHCNHWAISARHKWSLQTVWRHEHVGCTLANLSLKMTAPFRITVFSLICFTVYQSLNECLSVEIFLLSSYRPRQLASRQWCRTRILHLFSCWW